MRTVSRGVLLLLAAAACRSGPVDRVPASPGLPFMADDPAGALAVAKERQLPLFVETWAPW